jgi:hypothetical protein
MRFVCELCGAAIDFPQVAQPSIHIDLTNDEQAMRVLTIGNREIHRCPVADETGRQVRSGNPH